MLGGEYSILDIQGQYVQLTDNNINNCGMCNAGDLVPLSEVRYCDFSVGDQVKFLPKCDHIDIQFLQISLAYSFSEPNKQYRIVEILNDYYIFLDFKPENSSAIPFRWVDFQVV